MNQMSCNEMMSKCCPGGDEAEQTSDRASKPAFDCSEIMSACCSGDPDERASQRSAFFAAMCGDKCDKHSATKDPGTCCQ